MPGLRWECSDIDSEILVGTCKIVVEADRVHIRPDYLLEEVFSPNSPTSDGTLEIVVAEDDDDVQSWLFPGATFGTPPSGCDANRALWTGEQPEAWTLRWPVTSANVCATTTASAATTADKDAEPAGSHPVSPGRRGRGPGTAAPPGQGGGLDRDAGRSRGRGTAEAPNQGSTRGACEPLCQCLESTYNVIFDECLMGCAERTRGMAPSRQRLTCEAAFEEAGVSECREHCEAFAAPHAFAAPGGGER
jgi:hypothetical protein